MRFASGHRQGQFAFSDAVAFLAGEYAVNGAHLVGRIRLDEAQPNPARNLRLRRSSAGYQGLGLAPRQIVKLQ